MTQTFMKVNQAAIDDRQQNEHLEEASNGGTPRHVHIAILGTGFSGLGMAIRLKQRGEHDFVVLEKSNDIGGTWRDNTYPGCACDIPSHLYSFSFALNPLWSRAYATQPEIWDYLRRCARRYGIMPHIQWNSELLDATWNDVDQCWHITTTRGRFTANILVLGYGPLSEPSLPDIQGIESFEGVLFHSAQWRHDYDLAGKCVAVIGIGASAVQFVPQIQPKVDHLALFLRTPPWIIPRLDQPIPLWKRNMYRLLPFTQLLRRARIYARLEIAVLGMVYRPQALEEFMGIARRHLERQVPDPALRAKLTPNYLMGCKRILLSDDFYPSLTQPNVEVISERIREVRARSVVTADGVEREVDTIICGTGFHVTDSQIPRCIHGQCGQSLAERWRDGYSAYLGTTVSGFPNMFLLIGPNTGLGHNSMVYMIESQINYIVDCLGTMQRRNIQAIEVRPAVQEAFNEHLQARLKTTVWQSGCKSWYLDAHGRNTTIWPGFTFEFRHRTRHFDPKNYELVGRRSRVLRARS